jgi:hypothetical protein
MTTTPPDPTNPNPLGAFAALVGVLAIFLFFTGWVYRWAYFGFFELEVNSLNFSAESFFLVPIQVILGDLSRLLWAVLIMLLVSVLIKATLWLLEPLSAASSRVGRQPSSNPWLERLHRFPLCRGLRQITDLFPQPLRRDLIIVAWVLIALFWLARWQGTEDAWRDAVDPTSTRPIVTLVSPSDKIALGATLNDQLIQDEGSNPEIPALKNLRIFGDVEQFRRLYGNGINRAEGAEPIIWRLLIESGNWLYLFPALPKRQPDLRPPVVAVNTGDGRVQSVILSRPKVNP